MQLFKWTPDCSVNVAQFDKQHQHMFFLINDLNTAMRAGQGKIVVGNVVLALVAYTKDHFAAEEAAMRRTSYPKLAEHYEQHREFTTRVLEFQAACQSGNKLISIEVLQFLSSWLQNHILRSDKAYVDHLNKNGVH